MVIKESKAVFISSKDNILLIESTPGLKLTSKLATGSKATPHSHEETKLTTMYDAQS